MHESPTPYWMWHLTLSLFFIFILSPEKRVPDDKVFLAWGDASILCTHGSGWVHRGQVSSLWLIGLSLVHC